MVRMPASQAGHPGSTPGEATTINVEGNRLPASGQRQTNVDPFPRTPGYHRTRYASPRPFQCPGRLIGPGRHPFKVEDRVQIPARVPKMLTVHGYVGGSTRSIARVSVGD